MTDTRRSLGEALAALRDARATVAAHSDLAFHRQLDELRHWQSTRLASFHARRAAAYNGQALLYFLTHTFYRDADWSELTARPTRVARLIERLVEHDQPLVIAIELQAAAERLDIEIVETLISEQATLNPHSYVRAMRRVGCIETRAQQLRWLDELVDLVADYADSRSAWWAFRLARAPARAVGLGHTYELLAEGFTAMRAARDFKTGTHEVIAAQRTRLARLLDARLPL